MMALVASSTLVCVPVLPVVYGKRPGDEAAVSSGACEVSAEKAFEIIFRMLLWKSKKLL